MARLPRNLLVLAGLLFALAALAGCGNTAAQIDAAPAAASVPTEPATPTVAPSSTAAPTETVAPATSTAVPPTSTPTLSPTSTPTSSPTTPPTATPLPTDTPAPTPTPAPALRPLTAGGCCTQPFWSPDGERILFIDQPPDGPLGIWGVEVGAAGAAPALFTERIAAYTSDLAFVVGPDPADRTVTLIERVADGATWRAPAGGRSVSISPGRTRIAWSVSDESRSIEARTAALWVANLDGSDARLVASLPRGGLSGWIDEETLLVSTRASVQAREQAIAALRLADGALVELARGERLRAGALSPDGAWFLYMVTFDPDPAANGLWLVRTDGSERRRLDESLFGSYRWRDARRLLIIPMRPAAEWHELWELDVETGDARRLTDPATASFKVANGDWTVSPDGRHVAFVSSGDDNIWLLELP